MKEKKPRRKACRKRKGNIFVVSGPSGAGKGTLVQHVLDVFADLALSVSATTRPEREGETDGKDYFFVNRERFREMMKKGELIEWARVFENHYYGTPKRFIDEALRAGRDVLLELDVRGAVAIRKAFPESVLIFVLPPTLKELEKRIRDRGKDSEEDIRLRLKRARNEIRKADIFDYLVVNDGLEEAKRDIECIVRARRLRMGFLCGTVARFLVEPNEKGRSMLGEA
jgi:guanylate kinase